MVLADTRGEMGLWYRLATVTFMGSSLLSGYHGRDPNEPAAHGSAIVHGPNVTRYEDRYARYTEAGAARLVRDAATLSDMVQSLMPPDQVRLHGAGGLGRGLERGGRHGPHRRHAARPARPAGGRAMRPPAFWYTPPDRPGLRARILSPLGWLYGQVTARRMARAGRMARAAAGDLRGRPRRGRHRQDAGCAGARPSPAGARSRAGDPVMRAWRAARCACADRSAKPYGSGCRGRGAAPCRLRADMGGAGSRDGRTRHRTGRSARGDGSRLHPDGGRLAGSVSFQGPDPDRGRCRDGLRQWPLHPGRAVARTHRTGLSRADLLLSVGSPAAQEGVSPDMGRPCRRPRIRGRMEPLETGMDWHGARVLAFAGTGQPDRFFAMLRDLGADLVRAEALEDHQPLTRRADDPAGPRGADPWRATGHHRTGCGAFAARVPATAS